MARGDGIDRTSARNMRLTTQKLKNAQQHNEREKDSYVNPDIVPERSHLNVHFKKPDGSYLEQFEQMEAAASSPPAASKRTPSGMESWSLT